MGEEKNWPTPLMRWQAFFKSAPLQWRDSFKAVICRVSKVLRTYGFLSLESMSMSLVIMRIPLKELFLNWETEDV